MVVVPFKLLYMPLDGIVEKVKMIVLKSNKELDL